MAQFTGPSIAEVPGWRVGLIFLLFCIIAILYDYGSSALDRYLRRRGKRALRHVVRRLQGELLVLGLLSLLLVAFEPYLLQICINCSGDACAWDCPAGAYQAEAQAGAGSGSGRRRALQAAGGAEPSCCGGAASRVLLASGAGGDLGCMQAAETCGPGSEPFWSQLAIVQAHLFLFTIAVVHILYACVSMLLCLWKLRRWRRYEEAACEQPLRPLHSRFLPRPGDGALTHLLRCTASMLADSVNADVYAALRRLFIERLDVHPSFNFHEFLTESMEEEFAGIVGVSSVLWCILLLWIMLPQASYQLLWLPALAMAAGFVVAVKLQSIIICLAEDAHQLYGGSSAHSPSPSPFQGIKLRLQRLSAFGKGAPHSQAGAGSSSDAGGPGAAPSASVAGGDMPVPTRPPWVAPQQEVLQQQGQHETPAGFGRAMDSDGAASLLGGDATPPDSNGSTSDEEEGEAGEEAEVAHALASAGAPPMQAAGLAAAGREAAQQAAEAEAASIVGCSARAGGPGEGDSHQREAAGQGSGSGGHSTIQRQQQQVEQALGQELSCDLEAQQQPQQAARAAEGAAHVAHPPSSVFRRCCPWLLPRLPWHRPQQRQRVAQAVARSQSFAEGYRGPDAAGLFWFGRPRIVLRIIQGIYFENSLSVAAVLFSLWQGIEFDWSRYGGWAGLGSMIALQLLLLAFMSLAVLPVYALTTAAGSHSAASVIQHALKKNIKPDVARALQHMSMNHAATPEGEGDPGADLAEDEQPPPPPAAAAAADQPGHAVPAPGSDAALLAWLPPKWGPPHLARHSAPLIRSLHCASPTVATPSGAVGPRAGNISAVAQAQAGAGSAPLPPLGSLQKGPHAWPGGTEALGSTAGSAASSAASGFDPAALAAAAAAALGTPAWEGDEEQRSITRLLGAMLQKQLQLRLERASPAASGRSLQSPLEMLSSSSDSGRAGLPRRASLATLSGSQAEREHPGSVETCPPAVGAQLLRQLGSAGQSMHMVPATADGKGRAHTGMAADGIDSSAGSQPGAAWNGSGSTQRPTLAQVRSLFNTGPAKETAHE